MRFYLKLTLFVALFAGVVSKTGRRMTDNLAYEARVALVCRFGNDADMEALLEDTGRMLATQRGTLCRGEGGWQE